MPFATGVRPVSADEDCQQQTPDDTMTGGSGADDQTGPSAEAVAGFQTEFTPHQSSVGRFRPISALAGSAESTELGGKMASAHRMETSGYVSGDEVMPACVVASVAESSETGMESTTPEAELRGWLTQELARLTRQEIECRTLAERACGARQVVQLMLEKLDG